MAVTYPFSFPEKGGRTSKITKDEEVEIWQNILDTINSLVSRCNSLNSTSISNITIVHQDSKPGPLTYLEYDSNIAAIEAKLNQIIVASNAQGLNATNLVNLIQASENESPLLIWQRDTNLKTIKTAINTINILYSWVE